MCCPPQSTKGRSGRGVAQMTPQLLLDHFNRISDGPDAIPRLRQFIVDLAVQGKLVEQDVKDESAVEMLRRIQAKKAAIAGALPPIESKELKFSLPVNWACERFGNILELRYGKALPATGRKASGPVAVYGSNGIVGYHSESLTNEPAIIVGRKGSAGALNISRTPSWTTDVAYFVIPPDCFDLSFLFRLLSALKLETLSRGIKPGLSRAEAYRLPIVIPPFSEQHRIVTKVDQLMALCDHLEVARDERESRLARFTASVHYHLSTHANTGVLQEYARVCLNNVQRLTTRSGQIPPLRQTILNLATRGELVPQDVNDERAEFLLERSMAEISAYAREHEIAPPRPARVDDGSSPHPAPKGWIWTRLSCLFKTITDGDHQPPPKSKEGVAFLTIGNITTGFIDFSNCRFVPPSYVESLGAHRRPFYGDILYTVVGATYGRPVLVETKRPFCVQRHIAILKPTSEIDPKFLRLLLASPLVYEQATRSATGAAQPTIALRPLRNFLVPLPPSAEQRRIVAKVDELMALCDRLGDQLAIAQVQNRRLLEALLSQAFTDNNRLPQPLFDSTRAIAVR